MAPTDVSNPNYFHKVVDCQWACPAHTPVPEYIRLIAEGRYSDAYMINRHSNVFPGVLGRTCDRPCEPACRRGRVEEEPVAICRLKRVAADSKDMANVASRMPKPASSKNGKRIALIGAGPASLTVARDLLLRAASRKAGLPVAQLDVSEGEIRKKDGSRIATFGELVDFVGDLSAMPPPPLKLPSEFKLLGKPLPRLDIPAKVMGAATFGIDVRRPGLLYAAVLNAPTFGGSASGFRLKGDLPKGMETVILVPGGIAAIGSSWWRANKLLSEGLEVQWQPGPEPKLDSASLWKRYETMMESAEPALTRTLGSESKAAKTERFEATYRAPYLAHATMEPMNCTAQVKAGGVEVWMPNQAPTLMRLAASEVANIKQADVMVHTTFLGGGFGRRAEVDLVRQAVTCALALPGRPVQVLWSREEDIRHDCYRPMALARWTADVKDASRAQRD